MNAMKIMEAVVKSVPTLWVVTTVAVRLGILI